MVKQRENLWREIQIGNFFLIVPSQVEYQYYSQEKSAVEGMQGIYWVVLDVELM